MKYLKYVAAVLLVLSWCALAATVTVYWDHTNSPEAIGYKVYYGTNSGNYTQSEMVGYNTNTFITNLNDNATYYFSVVSVDSTGIESDFSNEAVKAPQPPTTNSLPTVVKDFVVVEIK